MARARNIKPSFFRDAALVELPIETRLLFPGLWTLADREGRLEDKPKQIKMEIYPADSFDVDVMLDQLAEAGLIIRYQVDGKAFIQVRNFSKHQNPHRDEKPSTIPTPPEHCANTVQTPGGYGGNRASTSNLQPDSLITALSGNPADLPDAPTPVSEKPKNGTHYNPQAREVLDFLNSKTNRRYQPVEANLKLIVARLKEGASVEDCRAVVAKKCREWSGDEKMDEFLRPATLFNATKFAQYRGELTE